MYLNSVVAVPVRRNSYEAGHFVFKAGLLFTLLLLLFMYANSQGVSEIITDYNGYWKSSSSVVNPVKPDNSHNLLSFSYNGVRYSTGVNDMSLLAHGDTYVPGLYKALPVHQITGAANSNTKIGLGCMYDGVNNGPSNPPPPNTMTTYLTDGINGLDLGTCVANLPSGNLFFAVDNIRAGAIGDGIPDLVITQIADPSTSSLDKYSFTDVQGNTIGNTVDIVLNNLPVVGNWTADFYDANTNPMVLTGGFTHTDRPIRLWTADFSAFGINSSNINNIAYFKIQLNGNSDVAFVAYNLNAFNIISTLPSKFASFTGRPAGQQVNLSWQTVTEENSRYFIVESSSNGADFTAIDTVKAAGMSNLPRSYTYNCAPKTGNNYYRIKLVHIDGQSLYSSVIQVENKLAETTRLSCYPNPATNVVYLQHAIAAGNETAMIMYTNGTMIQQKHITSGITQTSFDIQSLPKGTYLLVLKNEERTTSKLFVKQ